MCASKWLKDFCRKEGFGLTCRAEYQGDNVMVIDWKKNGKKGKCRQTNMSAGTTLVMMTSIASKNIESPCLRSNVSLRLRIRARIVSAAGKKNTATLTEHLEDEGCRGTSWEQLVC